jgi:uncharacterized protein YaiI (UPF0178 family)
MRVEKSERESLCIWIDADACPQGIKEVLFRTSRRLQLNLVLVANQSMRVPVSPRIQVVTVRDGADIADNYIAEQMQPGDIVITSDIPLAARVVDKQGIAIGTRGELFDDASVHSRLASRNLMEQFRAAGEQTKGPRPFDNRDLQTFANTLDRVIVKQLKKRD